MVAYNTELRHARPFGRAFPFGRGSREIKEVKEFREVEWVLGIKSRRMGLVLGLRRMRNRSILVVCEDFTDEHNAKIPTTHKTFDSKRDKKS